MVKIWAHRGASAYAPENTLEAFALAADMKADGIELDVHLSLDGEVVVCHDDKVDRVSDAKGEICLMTLETLKQIDFGARHEKYRGARIPTLREVYALIAPTKLTVNVELKTDVHRYEGIEQKCLDIARACGMEKRVIYSSFNHDSLARLIALDPSVQTGLLFGKRIPDTPGYALSRRADAIHPYYELMYEGDVLARTKQAGVLVHPWTVDDPEHMFRLIEMGADALITNVPDVALRVRDGANA